MTRDKKIDPTLEALAFIEAEMNASSAVELRIEHALKLVRHACWQYVRRKEEARKRIQTLRKNETYRILARAKERDIRKQKKR